MKKKYLSYDELILKGNITYMIELGDSSHGNMVRLVKLTLQNIKGNYKTKIRGDKNMKKISNKLVFILILTMLFTLEINSLAFADNKNSLEEPVPYATYEKLSDTEAKEFEKQIAKENKDGVVLELNKLNFYQEPMRITNISENMYEIELYDLLFEYGTVRLSMESKDHDIPIDKIIRGKDTITIELEEKEYDCEIRIVDNDKNTITYLGTIIQTELGREFKISIIDEGNYSNIPLAPAETETDISTMNLDDTYSINSVTYESESNNTTSTADIIKQGNDMYGTMNGDRIDYYKITFVSSGSTNFWIGEWPEGKPHNLYVYKGTTLVGSSTKTTGTQQLVTVNVTPTTYYMKVELPESTNIPTNFNYRARVKFYGSLLWPVSNTNITACFGYCPNYAGLGVNGSGYHYGVDIGCALNTLVKSMNYGDVVLSTRYTTPRSGLETYGNYIEIVSENPLTTGSYNKYLKTRYCHLQTRSVSSGATVEQGQQVGYSGNTGYEENPDGSIDYNPYAYHLHMETLYGSSLTGTTWTRTNPLAYFPGKVCSHTYSLLTSGSYDSYDEQIPGISINGDFIETDSLINMHSEQLRRYGITKEDINRFANLLSNHTEFYEQYGSELLNITY